MCDIWSFLNTPHPYLVPIHFSPVPSFFYLKKYACARHNHIITTATHGSSLYIACFFMECQRGSSKNKIPTKYRRPVYKLTLTQMGPVLFCFVIIIKYFCSGQQNTQTYCPVKPILPFSSIDEETYLYIAYSNLVV